MRRGHSALSEGHSPEPETGCVTAVDVEKHINLRGSCSEIFALTNTVTRTVSSSKRLS